MRFVEGGGKPAIEASLAEDFLALLRRGPKISAADDTLRAASAAALTQAIDRVEAVQEQYLAAATVEEELEILQDRQKLLERALEIARLRLKAGEATRLETTTIQTQLIELQAERADRQAERTQQRLTLARLIGRPGGAIDWRLDRPTAGAPAAGTERQWIAAALAHRPELESKRWELAALGEEAALANWGLFEGSDLGVMSQRDPDWQVGPSVTVPVPLFDNGKARRDKAQAARMQAVREWVAAQRQVIEEVRQAYAALGAARAAAAKVGDELLPLLEQRRQQAETAWRAGDTDLTTLLLAQDTQATARAKWIELKEKAAVATVKLERAAGGRGAAAQIGATRPTTRPATQVK
jgi:cobalt-zinc-cadmium efflux system outer membrane protein